MGWGFGHDMLPMTNKHTFLSYNLPIPYKYLSPTLFQTAIVINSLLTALKLQKLKTKYNNYKIRTLLIDHMRDILFFFQCFFYSFLNLVFNLSSLKKL